MATAAEKEAAKAEKEAAKLAAAAEKEAATTTDAAEPKSARQARWEAFLVEARKVNPERFDRQKDNGEFDTIADTFV